MTLDIRKTKHTEMQTDLCIQRQLACKLLHKISLLWNKTNKSLGREKCNQRILAEIKHVTEEVVKTQTESPFQSTRSHLIREQHQIELPHICHLSSTQVQKPQFVHLAQVLGQPGCQI